MRRECHPLRKDAYLLKLVHALQKGAILKFLKKGAIFYKVSYFLQGISLESTTCAGHLRRIDLVKVPTYNKFGEIFWNPFSGMRMI